MLFFPLRESRCASDLLPDDWSVTRKVEVLVALAMPLGWSDKAMIPPVNEA